MMNQQKIMVITVFIAAGLIVTTGMLMLSIPQETIDDKPPVITLIGVVDGDSVTNIVNITFSAEDENRIVSYEIWIDGTLRTNRQSMIWNVTFENIGRHTIICKAIDDSANVGSLTFKLTVEKPVNVPDLVQRPIKIMTYNIYESGVNPTWKQVIKDENADIIMLVETGDFDDYGNALLNRVVREFNEYFNDTYPYIGYTAQRISYDTSGEAILSRFPIIKFTQIPVVKLDNGEDYWVTHEFVDAVVKVNATNIHFIGCHLKASGGDNNEWRRERETEGIINYMDTLGDVPIIYLGDLNSFSPADTGDLASYGDLGVGPLTMMLRPDNPVYGNYSSKVHNFTDVFRTLNPKTPGYTFPQTNSRIDYILVNQYFENCLINSTVGDTFTAKTGSDHYSVDAFIKIYNTTTNMTSLMIYNYNHENMDTKGTCQGVSVSIEQNVSIRSIDLLLVMPSRISYRRV